MCSKNSLFQSWNEGRRSELPKTCLELKHCPPLKLMPQTTSHRFVSKGACGSTHTMSAHEVDHLRYAWVFAKVGWVMEGTLPVPNHIWCSMVKDCLSCTMWCVARNCDIWQLSPCESQTFEDVIVWCCNRANKGVALPTDKNCTWRNMRERFRCNLTMHDHAFEYQIFGSSTFGPSLGAMVFSSLDFWPCLCP